MFDITISSLFAGIIFGGVGLFLLRAGRSKSDNRLVVIGVLLMGYSYFTKNAFMDWGIGFGLSYLAYTIWN